jgi:uncharacterized protein
MVDDRISISCSRDGIEARASVVPGELGSLDDVLRALVGACVVHGIDETRCADLGGRLADPEFTVDGDLIATGTRAVPGRDGRLDFAFEPGIRPGTLRPDGSIDFLKRSMLHAVEIDEEIGSYEAARPGRPGRGVRGEELAVRPVSDGLPELGPGVCLQDDGRLVALSNGVVEYVEGKLIDVVDHYEHDGDVDLSTGHLDTDGSLTVRGGILGRLTVRSRGDVHIRDGVEGGSVLVGGNIVVAGGVIGERRSRLIAGGSIAVRHAQQAVVAAGAVLEIQSDAVGCRLRGVEILLNGRLIGGSARAETRIVAQQVGSPGGGPTALTVGEPLESQAEAARRLLAEARARRGVSRRTDRLARTKGGKAGRVRRILVGNAVQRRRDWWRWRRELMASACIEAQIAHGGVTVEIGGYSREVDGEARSVRFRLDSEAGEVILEPL